MSEYSFQAQHEINNSTLETIFHNIFRLRMYDVILLWINQELLVSFLERLE